MHADLKIPLLALACCLNLEPVIKTLLAREHSPHELITAIESCPHEHKQVSLVTMLKITEKFFHPEAFQILMRHLETAPLPRQDQARKRYPLQSSDKLIEHDYGWSAQDEAERYDDDAQMLV